METKKRLTRKSLVQLYFAILSSYHLWSRELAHIPILSFEWLYRSGRSYLLDSQTRTVSWMISTGTLAISLWAGTLLAWLQSSWAASNIDLSLTYHYKSEIRTGSKRMRAVSYKRTTRVEIAWAEGDGTWQYTCKKKWDWITSEEHASTHADVTDESEPRSQRSIGLLSVWVDQVRDGSNRIFV